MRLTASPFSAVSNVLAAFGSRVMMVLVVREGLKDLMGERQMAKKETEAEQATAQASETFGIRGRSPG